MSWGLSLCVGVVSHQSSNTSKWKDVCEQHVYTDMHLSPDVEFIHFMPKERKKKVYIWHLAQVESFCIVTPFFFIYFQPSQLSMTKDH